MINLNYLDVPQGKAVDLPAQVPALPEPPMHITDDVRMVYARCLIGDDGYPSPEIVAAVAGRLADAAFKAMRVTGKTTLVADGNTLAADGI